MLTDKPTISSQRIPCYCALCTSRCGSFAVVENGRFTALEPDPSHPTGKALCAKGRAAPELVYHADRLLYPMKRTRPKGDPDPGWQRISWEEALEFTAARLRTFAEEQGPESVVFSMVSPSTSASEDSAAWIQRLLNTFGSPNLCNSMELCGWGRHLATQYTFGPGAAVPGSYVPDLEHAGCILFWGYNPNVARLAHATATSEALKRGARLIVVDPRRTGPANKADVWLRVRPGTDAALALGITNLMLERDWYDRDFIRDWTNGPLLVRTDNGRLLTYSDLAGETSAGQAQKYVAWSETLARPLIYDPATGRYGHGQENNSEPALFGTFPIDTLQGKVVCRTVFDLTAEHCGRYSPEKVEAICGVGPQQIEEAARLLWEARPVAYYAWSGVEMQANSTQIARAIAQLYVLTGCLDTPGGNVLFPAVPNNNVTGTTLMPVEQRKRSLGFSERPLGPSRWGYVSTNELYRAIVEKTPYPVRGLVGFGANLLLSHSESQRGREALAALDFYVHIDLFMNPTAELADIVLPAASAFEREALKIGFDISAEAQSLVQLRQRVVEPRGEARSDTEIVFDLACRLGLGAHFWNGDIEAGYRHQLQPSGISLEQLRENPGGVRVPLQTRYRKFAGSKDGTLQGFSTPTRKIELYSEVMLEHGYPPLPEYEEPPVGPVSRPDLAERFPLILTCAKHNLFCESQHRALPSLRRRALDPEVELHPLVARERNIGGGDWVSIETPGGSVRARAKLNETLAPNVVCGQHGWWQACAEIGAPGYEAFSPEGANLNLIIGNDAIDPVSGSVPHRAYLCQVRRVVDSHE
ncbi:MAG: molybdopterin-dependent oxidoreductase [Chloroflexi bacterium]|nr:molybdopterin-dependent oxidoreductase [Chloroflexota bacterium]OJV90152.1 MAG: molybdopterin oxidoreductase [Chloroflexi bacterium 54-19]